ncbi:hypothetical protein JCM10212_005131 [Sporobolomyces blumeae]
MDSLDGNLHHSILSSLAANLSSHRPTEELDLLLAPLDDLPPPVASTSRLNGEIDPEDALTAEQLEGIVAFAEYVTGVSDPRERAGHAERILALAGDVRGWHVEEALGVQALREVPAMDRLTYALARAAMALSTSDSSVRRATLTAILELHSGLLQDLETRRDGERLITHTLPAIVGLSRAVSSPPRGFLFLPGDPYPSFPPTSTPPSTLVSTFRTISSPSSSTSYDAIDSPTSRTVKAVLDHYDSVDPDQGLTGCTGLASALDLHVEYWVDLARPSSAIELEDVDQTRWSRLVASRLPLTSLSSSLASLAAQTSERALQTWEETVARLEKVVEQENEREVLDEDEEDDGQDAMERETKGAGDVLVSCLRLASITSALSRNPPSDQLISTLESLLLPSSLDLSSGTTSTSLQLTALHCVRLLTRTLSDTSTGRTGFVDLVKEFLISPELGRITAGRGRDPYSRGRGQGASVEGDEEDEEGPIELVREAAETWVSLLPTDVQSRTSTLQTLINSLSLLSSFHPISAPTSPAATRDPSPNASFSPEQHHTSTRDREIDPAKIGQAVNVIHSIGILARSPLKSTPSSATNGTGSSKTSNETLRLAQSALQRLVTTPNASDALVIAGLYELALVAETFVIGTPESKTNSNSNRVGKAERDEFREIGRTIGAVGRGAVLGPPSGTNGFGRGRGGTLDDASPDGSEGGMGKEEAVYRAAVRALDRLGSIAAKRESDLGDDFLAEVLTLFVHRGTTTSEGGQKLSTERRTAALAGLLPVLANYLQSSRFHPSSTHTSTLAALFRSFWYICLLSSLFSRREASRTKQALLAIAERAPPLVLSGRSTGKGSSGNGDVWVEIESQVVAALKTSPPGAMTIEAVRGELATAIPSQAGSARSVSSGQAVFLATVLRLEMLRAEAGVVAPVFEYFKIPSLASEAGMGDCLKSIGEKVLATYVSHLSHLVPVHAVPAEKTNACLRSLLFQAADPSPEVRTMAFNYLNELLSSFPSLVCEAEVVTVMLELLTVLRRSCLAEFLDEYTPTFTFSTNRVSITVPDDYPLRQRILRELHGYVKTWLRAGLTRSPEAMKGILMEYITNSHDGQRIPSLVAEDEMGKSVALDLVRTPPTNGKSASLPAWGGWSVDSSSSFSKAFAAKSYFGGAAARSGSAARQDVLARLEDLSAQLDRHKLHYKFNELRDLFYAAGGLLVESPSAIPDPDLVHHLVSLPVRIFTEASIHVAQEVWTWVANARSELESRIVAEVVEVWSACLENEQGLFSRALDLDNPLNQETQFTPTDKTALTKEYVLASRVFAPMLGMLDFLSSRFQAFRYRNKDLVLACMRLVDRCLDSASTWSRHSLSRELRFRFLAFGFCILQGSEMENSAEFSLRNKLYSAAFDWFSVRPTWSFGTNRIQLKADLQSLEELALIVESDQQSFISVVSSSTAIDPATALLPGRTSVARAKAEHALRKELLKLLLDDEADRLRLWINPTQDEKRGPLLSSHSASPDNLVKLLRFAWTRWPKVVVQLPQRFKFPLVANEVTQLVRADPLRVQDCPDALAYFIDDSIPSESRSKLRHLLYWAPVPVPDALRFLFPKYEGDPLLLQYAVRVLEHHPVGITFFYIPQVVQALRTDSLGYAERFIFETSKISQLFCHQIIWNMKANAYRGDNAEEADPMKPTLDRVVDMIVDSLSGEAQDFYNREFSFFDEVTSISAKLKPFIKSSKAEKKAKIDEEMAKIKVDVGVYLPSNPDGVVVDINRKSGRPLQSHAKAPFMATFKVRRQREKEDVTDLEAQDELIDAEEANEGHSNKEDYDTWQSAIFKVGDDCRQDVLALQIIAMHKNIFNSLGLDLLVTPYRVTATGPGCGVIDVVPNATSRDEMGRAKINDLTGFFTMKYGPVDSIEFQKARTNFIQSMAAYSLLCYIVQIKDRHNGNIMIDGRGCITHIDFGFLFDIGPGGIKFEPDSFKLSHEMIDLMGGHDSPGFRNFVELTVKAFLACRPYAHQIVHTTSQMLAAEFPSFKGEATMDRLLARFRLDLSEKDAATYMLGVIANADGNRMSILYDRFQLATNGIPYTK